MSAPNHAAATAGAAANATAPLSSLAPVLSVEHLSMRFVRRRGEHNQVAGAARYERKAVLGRVDAGDIA